MLRPSLAFRISAETCRNARDLTVDGAGNVFGFDYDEYFIRQFDSAGILQTTFGGAGHEPGRFEHLMAIKAHGDSILALDAGSVSVFDLAGNPRSQTASLLHGPQSSGNGDLQRRIALTAGVRGRPVLGRLIARGVGPRALIGRMGRD